MTLRHANAIATQGDRALLELAMDRSDRLDAAQLELTLARSRLTPYAIVHAELRERYPDVVTDDPTTIGELVDTLSSLVLAFAPAEHLAAIAADLAERSTLAPCPRAPRTPPAQSAGGHDETGSRAADECAHGPPPSSGSVRRGPTSHPGVRDA